MPVQRSALNRLFSFGATTRLREKMLDSLDARKDATREMPWDRAERMEKYLEWEELYENSIYFSQNEGGRLEEIVRTFFGNDQQTILKSFLAPTKQIVEAYQNCLYGTFGNEITPTIPKAEKAAQKVEDALQSAIARVWKYSNLDTAKGLYLRTGAMTGTVGIRITARDDEKAEKRRVRLVIEHPRRIDDFEEDAEGNVQAVLLKYETLMGKLGAPKQATPVIEYIGKDRFWKIVGGTKVFDNVNPLGVCPYIIARHLDRGGEFGVPPFFGSDVILHLINMLVSRQDDAIRRAIYAKIFASGAGDAPKKWDIGDLVVIYAQARQNDPPPDMRAINAEVNQQQVTEFWKELMDNLRQRQPEMLLGNVQAMANQSGETIAQLLKPATLAIMNARTNYESALIRAIKIAISWGIMMEVPGFDLNTGTGEAADADEAYHSGAMEFVFNQRPALAESSFERNVREQADRRGRTIDVTDAVAASAITSRRDALMIMTGDDEERVTRVMNEIATEDTILTDAGAGDGTDTTAGGNGSGADSGGVNRGTQAGAGNNGQDRSSAQ